MITRYYYASFYHVSITKMGQQLQGFGSFNQEVASESGEFDVPIAEKDIGDGLMRKHDLHSRPNVVIISWQEISKEQCLSMVNN